MPFFEIGQFLGIVSFEFASHIICCLKDTLHILLSDPLAFKELSLGPLSTVLHALQSLLKTEVLSAEEILVLSEDVDLTAE